MFTQCSPRLHVCRSVTHSLMSAGKVRPSEAGGGPGLAAWRSQPCTQGAHH